MERVALDLDPRSRDIDELLRELALLKPSRTRTIADLVAAEEDPKEEVLFLLQSIGEVFGWQPAHQLDETLQRTWANPEFLPGLDGRLT